jgi:hypothetical protein
VKFIIRITPLFFYFETLLDDVAARIVHNHHSACAARRSWIVRSDVQPRSVLGLLSRFVRFRETNTTPKFVIADSLRPNNPTAMDVYSRSPLAESFRSGLDFAEQTFHNVSESISSKLGLDSIVPKVRFDTVHHFGIVG